MVIIIRTIPHKEQRYDTIGDWYWSPDGETLNINVSKMEREDSEFLVGFHEAIEAYIFTRNLANKGLATEVVDEFDKSWAPSEGIEEPGDDPKAPYYREHRIATIIEQQLAHEMGYNWQYHEELCDKTFEDNPRGDAWNAKEKK